MNPNDMTLKELREIPLHEEWDVEHVCDSFIILPGSGRKHELHDSGYRCMSFVLVRDGKVFTRISDCSDVVHLGGIGGFGGQFDLKTKDWLRISPLPWSVDCLPKSGMLHFFLPKQGYKLKMGKSLSSQEVFAVIEEVQHESV